MNLAFQRYLSARQQVEAYYNRILKDAAASLELVRLGYQKGDPKYDYTAVLQAQVILSQAKLVYAQGAGRVVAECLRCGGAAAGGASGGGGTATAVTVLPLAA